MLFTITIYNSTLDCNKRILNKVKIRERKTATSVKYTKILQVLSEFENMSAAILNKFKFHVNSNNHSALTQCERLQ